MGSTNRADCGYNPQLPGRWGDRPTGPPLTRRCWESSQGERSGVDDAMAASLPDAGHKPVKPHFTRVRAIRPSSVSHACKLAATGGNPASWAGRIRQDPGEECSVRGAYPSICGVMATGVCLGLAGPIRSGLLAKAALRQSHANGTVGTPGAWVKTPPSRACGNTLLARRTQALKLCEVGVTADAAEYSRSAPGSARRRPFRDGDSRAGSRASTISRRCQGSTGGRPGRSTLPCTQEW
jgi:hypothetical protein